MQREYKNNFFPSTVLGAHAPILYFNSPQHHIFFATFKELLSYTCYLKKRLHETFCGNVFANYALIASPTAGICDNNLLDLKIFNSLSAHLEN